MRRSPEMLSLFGRAMRRLPPRMRGKARLARRLLGSRLHARDVALTTADGSRFVVPSLSDAVGFHLFVDGVYEPDEVAWVLAQLRPGDVFVDVGANIGAFTLAAARRVGAAGRVIAIEPSVRIASYLEANVAANGLTNVTIRRVALDETARAGAEFYEAPLQRFGTGSFSPAYGGRAVRVDTTTVDELLAAEHVARVRVLKIDVEGFEARVLRGAMRLLREPHRPAVLFEHYAWAEQAAGAGGEAQRLLDAYGYDVVTVAEAARRRAAAHDGIREGNLVALPRDGAGRAARSPAVDQLDAAT